MEIVYALLCGQMERCTGMLKKKTGHFFFVERRTNAIAIYQYMTVSCVHDGRTKIEKNWRSHSISFVKTLFSNREFFNIHSPPPLQFQEILLYRMECEQDDEELVLYVVNNRVEFQHLLHVNKEIFFEYF